MHRGTESMKQPTTPANELKPPTTVGTSALLGVIGVIITSINSIVLTYLNNLGNDAIKVISVRWLLTVNLYAFGVILFYAVIKPRREKRNPAAKSGRWTLRSTTTRTGEQNR